MSAKAGVYDTINVLAVTVIISGETKTVDIMPGPPVFIQVPFSEFNNATGSVKVGINGVTVEGPAISDRCPESGVFNFNAVAIHAVAPFAERPMTTLTWGQG